MDREQQKDLIINGWNLGLSIPSMMDWLADNGYHASESQIKSRCVKYRKEGIIEGRGTGWVPNARYVNGKVEEKDSA